jgi:hypothetical protein
VVAQVEKGTVREIWLAPLSDPSDKSSFLIRDESYSRSGALFGRTMRLGDPINLGPNSNWRTTTWEGGFDQEFEDDPAMFYRGNADSVTKRGRVRLHTGYTATAGNSFRAVSRYVCCPGVVGLGATSNLIIGEDNNWELIDPTTGTILPNGNFKLYEYNPSTGVTTLITSFTEGGIRAMCRLNDEGSPDPFICIGKVRSGGGEVGIYNDTSNTYTAEKTDLAKAVEYKTMAQFNNAVYYGAGDEVWKRTYPVGGPATHTLVGRVPMAGYIRGMTTWNGRLWFGTITSGNFSQVFVTTGAVLQYAFTIPEDYEIETMVTHYGSLYICGVRFPTVAGERAVGVIWRYDGNSLRKLYEEPAGPDNLDHGIRDMCVVGKYLAWGQNGHVSTGQKPGVKLYDPELDAIHEGPTLDMDPAGATALITSVTTWAHSFTLGVLDFADYSAGAVKKPSTVFLWNREGGKTNTLITGTSVGLGIVNTAGVKEQYLTSSKYDGDLPGEAKTWLSTRLRVKVPSGTAIQVKVMLDEATTELDLGTIAYDATAGDVWRTVRLLMKGVSGAYLKSTTIQTKLYLRHLDRTNTSTTSIPEVSSAEVEYMVAPTKRRSWRLRAYCSDAQSRLDGSANPLTTSQAQRDKLEALWASQEPVLFWDARSVGGTPTTGSVEVMLSEWLDQPYRLESDSSQIEAEVSMTAIEVVNA